MAFCGCWQNFERKQKANTTFMIFLPYIVKNDESALECICYWSMSQSSRLEFVTFWQNFKTNNAKPVEQVGFFSLRHTLSEYVFAILRVYVCL